LQFASDILRQVKACYEKAYEKEPAFQRDKAIEDELFSAAQSIDTSWKKFEEAAKSGIFKYLDYKNAEAVLRKIVERLRNEPAQWENVERLERKIPIIMAHHPDAKLQNTIRSMTGNPIGVVGIGDSIDTECIKRDFAAAMDKLIVDIAFVVEAAQTRNMGSNRLV
jgi:hypothetical protein